MDCFGSKLEVTNELKLIRIGEKDGYHYFQMTNSLDDSTLRFAVITAFYDFVLNDFEF